jgi:hypothetical protein
MRYGSDYEEVTITRPVAFDYNTEFDYLFEISEASKAGLPPVAIHAIIVKYLKSHFYTGENLTRAFDLIIKTDRLLGLSDEDVMFGLSKGTIANWESVVRDSAVTLIGQLRMADENFFNQPVETQQQQLIEKAKEVADANKPQTGFQELTNSLLG